MTNNNESETNKNFIKHTPFFGAEKINKSYENYYDKKVFIIFFYKSVIFLKQYIFSSKNL